MQISWLLKVIFMIKKWDLLIIIEEKSEETEFFVRGVKVVIFIQTSNLHAVENSVRIRKSLGTIE